MYWQNCFPFIILLSYCLNVIPFLYMFPKYFIMQGPLQNNVTIWDYPSRVAFIQADCLSQPPYLRYALKPSYVLAPKSPQNCDTLIIERYDEHWHWFDVNPAPFMSFIEGVMGYEQGRHDGYMISYTRRKPFNDTVRWGIPPAYTSTEGT